MKKSNPYVPKYLHRTKSTSPYILLLEDFMIVLLLAGVSG
jgi:hypothetical protein